MIVSHRHRSTGAPGGLAPPLVSLWGATPYFIIVSHQGSTWDGGATPYFSTVSPRHLGVTSCPPSRTPYTRDLTIFYISTLSMLFDVCDQSCWQSCVTPVEIRVDVLALCFPVF